MSIQSVRGMHDVFGEEAIDWSVLETKAENMANVYGYQEIRTPIVERSQVFERAVGQDSDIASKEMYSFLDKGGESLVLRPELTAAVVRAVVQHDLLKKSPLQKLWYFGPMFRYERPQLGRQRQFHQLGAECIGSPYVESDIDVLQFALDLLKDFNIEDLSLHMNSLGSGETRQRYRESLIEYFTGHRDALSPDSQNRLATNPLRILDSKNPGDKVVAADAPKLRHFLNAEEMANFEKIAGAAAKAGANVVMDDTLVRGLDYYNDVVYEFKSTTLGAQDAIGGGGRYNGLFEYFGAPPCPCVGFSLGIERIVLIRKKLELFALPDAVDAYIIATDDATREIAMDLAHTLRKKFFSVLVDLQRRSVKAQFREADKNRCLCAIILGQEELKRNAVVLKVLESGEQEEVPVTELIGRLKQL